MLLAIAIALTSCYMEVTPLQESVDLLDEIEEPTFGTDLVLGEKLDNPYSLKNMQAAYETLLRTKFGEDVEVEELQANCLYVRFLPKDSTDVLILQESNLELFSYPLDYDIEIVGDTYHDPSLPADQLTWYYTTVTPDFVFPDMDYEILEECYLPEESELTKANGIDFSTELECLAIHNANLPKNYQVSAETKALGYGTRPTGTLKVYNDDSRVDVPIRGVKVRCHFFVNISSCYTDDNGRYQIKTRYVTNPHYSIVYENIKSFIVWGNNLFIAPANYNMGYRSKNGYSTTIASSSGVWRWAVINNATYDFYKMCETEGLKTPPPHLVIWCWPTSSSSSAPMLRHLIGVSAPSITTAVAGALLSNPATGLIGVTMTAIASAFPDITIGMTGNLKKKTPNSHYNKHYTTIWHELFHASHFSQVGEALWAPYINYIVTHDGYGDGFARETAGKNICELGEAWAYANQEFALKKPGEASPPIITGDGVWVQDGARAIYSLINSEKLTRKQIYDCLTKDVMSMKSLKKELINKYPSKKDDINKTLRKW